MIEVAGIARNLRDAAAGAVWQGMTQAELDDAYDQLKHAPNMQQVLARFATNSEAVRARLGTPQRISYGQSAVETLDLYRAESSNAGIVVYIHGGAWRTGVAQNHAYAAGLFVGAGHHFAVLDFINVIEAGGDLRTMVDQVRRAVPWVYTNASTLSADRSRIFICGHSSGAHLGGVLLTTEWARYGMPRDVIKGALLTSGIYDLKPVRLSARNAYIKFSDVIEKDFSPQRHLENLHCSVTLAYGSLESPEFQRQSHDFAAAIDACGKRAKLLKADGYNHFEVAETLANPDGLLGGAMLEILRPEEVRT